MVGAMGTSVGTDWADWIAALSSAATLIVIIWGGVLAWRQLNATASSRNAAMLAEYSRRWDELLEERKRTNDYEGAEDLAAAIDRLWRENDVEFYRLSRIPSLLEDLAIQVDERNIPLPLVQKYFQDSFTYYWERWRTATENLRHDHPTLYEHFEELAERLRATEQI
jgi:hypothetical protein